MIKIIMSTVILFAMQQITFGQYELDWNSRIGSTAHDDSRGIVELGDFIYATGRIEAVCSFEDTDLFGDFTSNGMDDIFISKMDKDGNYIWVKTMGGTLGEQGVEIEAGTDDDIYISGYFESDFDIDPGVGVVMLNATGERDVFVARFSTDGDLVWGKQISGTLTEQCEGLAISSDGVVLSGKFKGTMDCDPGVGVANVVAVGNNDIFVCKLSLDGDFDWAESYGGTGNDIASTVISDGSDNLYITGQFRNTIEFEAGDPVSVHTSIHANDIYILKLDTDGNYVWSKAIGGTGNQTGAELKLDADNNLYITGFYQNTVDFDPGAGVANHTSEGGTDIYLVKLDDSGEYVWSNSVGGAAGDDKGKGIEVDAYGNLYLVGLYRGTIDLSGTEHTSNGLTDCFIEKMDLDGNHLWSAAYGGVNDDFLNGIIVDIDTCIYFNGKFSSETDIDPSDADSLVSPIGDIDGYIFKWKTEDILVTSITVEGEGGATEFTMADATLPMEATVLPLDATDATYTWSVTDMDGSATIDALGILTAVSAGTVLVTATANDDSGISGSTEILITNVLVSSIMVQGEGGATEFTMADATLLMEAIVLPLDATDPTYTWSVTDMDGSATIDALGILTAVSAGTVLVTATANDESEITGSTEILITNVLVETITVQGEGGVSEITVEDGTLQMEAEILPLDVTDPTYTWSVADGTGSATIDVTGILTAVADGIVLVTATANDDSGITGSTEILISNQSVSINESYMYEVTFYPNPTKDKLYIEVEEAFEASITVYSILGDIMNVSVERANNLIEINTKNLPTGTYVVEIDGMKFKFLKQ